MGQVHDFPKAAAPAVKLEVHEHCFVRGPRASGPAYKFEHSHEGGSTPHTHPDTGPASYTIDREEWLRATGMRGGGRKRFSARPTGEQFVAVPRTDEESYFEIIVGDPPAPPEFTGEGGGHHAAARMVLTFGLTPVVKFAGPPTKTRA